MANQNNNIAATIIPTDSGRELLQDIYGGGGSTFILQHRTQKYKVGDMLSNNDMNAIFNIEDNDIVLLFVREDNQYLDPFMCCRFAEDESSNKIAQVQTYKIRASTMALMDEITVFTANGVNQGITEIRHVKDGYGTYPDEFYVEIYKYQTE